MNKNDFIKVLCTLMLLMSTISIAAQITFGSLEAPETGALLQLKNLDESSSNNSSVNATKGLLLPRVKLEHIYNLYPMFEPGYDKNAEDLKHTGLFVYNINEDLYDGDGAGCYMWDGEKWIGMGIPKRRITVNPLNIYISERVIQATAKINTTPLNFPFTVTTSGRNSCSHTLENGRITFTINPDISGNKEYKLTMNNSSRSVTLTVNHLKLKLAKDIIKSGEFGLISSSAVEVDGGDGKWVVKSFTEDLFNWVVEPYNDGNNNLCFELGRTRQEGTVKGSITVAHVNDPNYTKTIEVWQNKDYIILPPFDYLVVRYTYPNRPGSKTIDLDTATELLRTGIPSIDNKAVGWSTGTAPTFPDNADKVLIWGGDNTQSGYETVYCNMTKLRDKIPETSSREFFVDMYGNWYAPRPYGPDNVKITITLYRGGTMVQGNQNDINTKYDFFNVDGVNVLELTKDNLLVSANKTGSQYARDYRSNYNGLLRLEYDRVDETGLIMRFADIQQTTQSSDNIMLRSIQTPEDKALEEAIRSFEMLPNETKDESEKRFNQLLKDLTKKYKK